MDEKYVRIRLIDSAVKAQRDEPLSEVARILPPLLGNLRAFQRVAELSPGNKAEFKKIEEWLIAYSQTVIQEAKE